MKLIFLFLFTTTHLVFSQQLSNSHKNDIELAIGYTTYNKSYNGAYLSAEYHYFITKNLAINSKLLFAKAESKKSEPFQAINLAIGTTGVFDFFSKSEIRVGLDFGIINIKHPSTYNNITIHHSINKFSYGGSASYLFALNSSLNIGIKYSVIKIIAADRNMQNLGVNFIKYF